jgi:5-methylcytosine-specific restriction endonuclease McrA
VVTFTPESFEKITRIRCETEAGVRPAGRCYLCHEPGDERDPLEVDHVIPRAQGGTDDRSNLHAGHRLCNRRRGQGADGRSRHRLARHLPLVFAKKT